MAKPTYPTYIFRWRNSGIEVRPSHKTTQKLVWDWAIENLRPADMDDDTVAEQFVRANGEVVEFMS